MSKTGFENVLSILRDINLYYFALAVFLYLFTQFVSTFRWKPLLPHTLGIKKLFPLYMIGAFFNTLLPGIIGGDAVKGFYLYKETGKGSLTLASIFMDRYIGFVVLIAICVIALLFGYEYLHGSRIEWLLFFVVLCFIGGSLLVFCLRLGKRIKTLSDFYEYFHAYRNQKEVIGKALILSILIHFLGIFAVYTLALGIGYHIPFVTFLIFLPLIVLFTTLPISISGLGVREGAFILFFGFIGVKPEVATAISLSWFVTIAAG
jgi:uncharacterized membrane protein YbhN (UPF0104 family)